MKETLTDLAKQIEAERMIIVEHLGTGCVKDYAQYQQACGKILGLMTVTGFIAERLRSLQEDGDDE